MCAPDAAAMVLDAVAGFYSGYASGAKGTELHFLKNACVMGGLIRVKPEVTVELMEKAMAMAVHRNQIRVSERDKHENTLGFLLLVEADGLRDELIDCFVTVGRKRHIVHPCRENINDVIQKLINKGMHIAVLNLEKLRNCQ